MGTNYYVKDKNLIECSHKDQYDEEFCWDCYNTGYKMLHIGKSSYGWTFTWHCIVEENLCSSLEWYEYLKDSEIWNEYGERVELSTLLELIKSKETSEKNHTIYCRNSDEISTRRHGIEDCYLDPWGHSFSKGEFS
jgi:hypothetical protein